MRPAFPPPHRSGSHVLLLIGAFWLALCYVNVRRCLSGHQYELLVAMTDSGRALSVAHKRRGVIRVSITHLGKYRKLALPTCWPILVYIYTPDLTSRANVFCHLNTFAYMQLQQSSMDCLDQLLMLSRSYH